MWFVMLRLEVVSGESDMVALSESLACGYRA
jgi:hypothetical protein